MNFKLNFISEVSAKLQKQKDLPFWVVADSPLIDSIATNRPKVYGKRGLWIKALFEILGTSWLGLLALRGISFISVSLWFIKSLMHNKTCSQPECLFIGFGAGPEATMLKAFRLESNRNVLHLNQTDPFSMSTVGLPCFKSLLFYSWVESSRVVQGIKFSKCPYIKNYANQWIATSAIKIGIYVYFKALAENLPKSIQRVLFISPDTPAFGMLDAKKKTSQITIDFRQHGLLRRSLIFPCFNNALALNFLEAEFIRKSNPEINVEYSSVDLIRSPLKYKPHILLSSMYDTAEFNKHDHLDLLKNLICWAKDQNLRVIVRPHPCEDFGFWSEFFPEILVDSGNGSFEECLSLWNPQLVVSWFSTTLLDAIKRSILPILIMPGSERALTQMVFPLEQISVKWPEQQFQLERLIKNPTIYSEYVRGLRKQLFDVKDSNY